mmetsp:Transcript_8434/g.26225  ORF Transcript_8434/g.26225 Transcript_8434/m.26225 type:complete len:247 (-) Transcript_8434:208-948(-)
MTTAVMSSDSWPCVSACQRCRATPVISRAAMPGSLWRAAMSTASCDSSRSQTPSEPRISTLSRWQSFLSLTSGCDVTNGRMPRSPMERATPRPQVPVLSQTRSGPTRTMRTGAPKPGRTGMALWCTAPPSARMRRFSSSRPGFWSQERSTARRGAPKPGRGTSSPPAASSQHPSTARESPTLATCSVGAPAPWRCSSATVAVQPLFQAPSMASWPSTFLKAETSALPASAPVRSSARTMSWSFASQ